MTQEEFDRNNNRTREISLKEVRRDVDQLNSEIAKLRILRESRGASGAQPASGDATEKRLRETFTRLCASMGAADEAQAARMGIHASCGRDTSRAACLLREAEAKPAAAEESEFQRQMKRFSGCQEVRGV